MLRYWPLLAATPNSATPNGAHHEGGPLKFAFACLSSPKASQKVCECVVGMAVNLLTLGRGDGGRRGGEEERIAAEGVGEESGSRRGGGVEAMDTGHAEDEEGERMRDTQGESGIEGADVDGKEDSGGVGGRDGDRTPSGEEMVTPFIPCLLAYLNRVIGENVGKAQRIKERGRSLDSEFVMLSR